MDPTSIQKSVISELTQPSVDESKGRKKSVSEGTNTGFFRKIFLLFKRLIITNFKKAKSVSITSLWKKSITKFSKSSLVSYVNNFKASFSEQSGTTKKSLLRHGMTTFGFAISLLFHQLAEVGALQGASIGEVGLGVAGLCFEICNLAQMAVRLMSFIKLYRKAKADPNSVSEIDRAKIQSKLTNTNLVSALSELAASLFAIASHIFRIVAAFVPGLALGVILLSFFSALSGAVNAFVALMKDIKDPNVSKKQVAFSLGVFILNALATCAFLSQAILVVSPPPLAAIATLSFAILQFIYVAISISNLKEKAEQKLNLKPA